MASLFGTTSMYLCFNAEILLSLFHTCVGSIVKKNLAVKGNITNIVFYYHLGILPLCISRNSCIVKYCSI